MDGKDGRSDVLICYDYFENLCVVLWKLCGCSFADSFADGIKRDGR